MDAPSILLCEDKDQLEFDTLLSLRLKFSSFLSFIHLIVLLGRDVITLEEI